MILDTQIKAWSALPIFLLKVPSEHPQRSDVDISVQEKTQEHPWDKGDAIVCRQCHRTITRTTERIEVQHAHQHTFANPHGVVFQIQCFQSAQSVGHVGPQTDEFSWFLGYSWKIIICISCLSHLGWRFSLKNGSGFYGLIADRLIEPD